MQSVKGDRHYLVKKIMLLKVNPFLGDELRDTKTNFSDVISIIKVFKI
jgi:hypothetical protein